MKYRDERVRKLADTVSCVRLVKFYAWEDAVAQAVTVFRDREGFFIFLVNGFDGFVDSLQNSSSSLVSTCTVRPGLLSAA
ncbi:hypothetical protein HPB48_021007 [Haemaphysalis longicornis]|uniref:Uncharacterized protein n=1 Tax=Haemaphysalis longicornis TaxID=44386 RepID=A0A9J6FPU2_HAELO|nr:hypothetical protein HPB48_021007 [Haemaphysalis longicornis]